MYIYSLFLGYDSKLITLLVGVNLKLVYLYKNYPTWAKAAAKISAVSMGES